MSHSKAWFPEISAGHVAGTAALATVFRQAGIELRPRMKRGVQRQQFVELGRVVTDTIGPGDEDLPTLFCKSPPFGDSDDNAQPNRCRGFFTP
jgi:hypothetical protein